MRRVVVLLVALAVVGCEPTAPAVVDATNRETLADSLFAIERELSGEELAAFQEAAKALQGPAILNPAREAEFRRSIDGADAAKVIELGVAALREDRAARQKAVAAAEAEVKALEAAKAEELPTIEKNTADAEAMIAGFDAGIAEYKKKGDEFRAEYERTVGSETTRLDPTAIEKATKIMTDFEKESARTILDLEQQKRRVQAAIDKARFSVEQADSAIELAKSAAAREQQRADESIASQQRMFPVLSKRLATP